MSEHKEPAHAAEQPIGKELTRILVAEDEELLANLMVLSLEARGYTAYRAADGEQAVSVFDKEPIDLVILDVMMPRMDGFAALREIRRRSDVPVILVTALGNVEDVVKGFEMGADDYVTKPFTFKELEARIQAILRRATWGVSRTTPQLITIGNVSIDGEAHEVHVSGATIHLTPIEFQLLYYLMSHAGTAVRKETLVNKVWGYDFVGGTNLVEVGVRRLREKIEERPSQPRYILTVRGVGYKFVTNDDLKN